MYFHPMQNTPPPPPPPKLSVMVRGKTSAEQGDLEHTENSRHVYSKTKSIYHPAILPIYNLCIKRLLIAIAPQTVDPVCVVYPGRLLILLMSLMAQIQAVLNIFFTTAVIL